MSPYTTLHYTTHYTTHYILQYTLHYTTLPYSTHYTTPTYSTHYTTLHYSTHYPTLHYTTLQEKSTNVCTGPASCENFATVTLTEQQAAKGNTRVTSIHPYIHTHVLLLIILISVEGSQMKQHVRKFIDTAKN